MANSRLHSATDAAPVTPNDTVDDTTKITSAAAHGDPNPAGYVLGVAGDIRVRMISGNTVTFPNMAAGVTHGCQFTHVLSTGTTATGIIAVFQ